MLPFRGEVCPPQALGAPAPDAAETQELAALAPEERHVEYVGFTAECGSASKMAIVRRRLARVLGPYLLGDPIAAGEIATVHLGRLLGPAGFSRTVAVKRLHAHLAADPAFVQRFIDDARIASRVRHTNVVQTLDVVAVDDELLLVTEYIHGESLARLRRLASAEGGLVPPRVVSSVVSGVLRGLHAAHESKSARGAPLELVHRDVSPQNILVGADGVARVLDIGVATAAGYDPAAVAHEPQRKRAYMAPEQVAGEVLDRRADLFATGVVLWEALAGERLFRDDDTAATVHAIRHREVPRLSERGLGMSPAVDAVLARALAEDPSERFGSADAMARALEAALTPASPREVADWVETVATAALRARAELVVAFERDDSGGSVARLHAARPSGPSRSSSNARRDALVPPPLESVTSEHTTLRRPPRTLPTLEMEAEIALAATGTLPRRVLPPTGSEGASEARALLTPLVMVAPSIAIHEAPESGKTRIEPVERRPRNRTPFPVVAPTAKRGARGPSMWQLAVLVMVPPILVAAAVLGVNARPPAAAGVAQAVEVPLPAAAAPASASAAPAAVAPLLPVPAVHASTTAPPSPPLPEAHPKAEPRPKAKSPDRRRAAPAHRPLRHPTPAIPLPSDR